MLPVHTILCPLDFSDPSEKAIQIATEMATHFQAELLFVHVIPPDVPDTIPDPAFAFPGPEAFQHTLTLNAQKRLEAVAQRTPSTVKSRAVIGNGDPADEIVRIATEEGADLIVIATHGVTGWRHFIFGSVAEKVIRLADRPVLVVPAKEPEKCD